MKKAIAIDLDGVLADYSKGWQGEEIIGEPLPGAREFLIKLHDAGYWVMLFTTRASSRVNQWCRMHDIPCDSVNCNPNMPDVGNPGKPVAQVYLDDRGLRFNGNFDEAFEQITQFKTWYDRV